MRSEQKQRTSLGHLAGALLHLIVHMARGYLTEIALTEVKSQKSAELVSDYS